MTPKTPEEYQRIWEDTIAVVTAVMQMQIAQDAGDNETFKAIRPVREHIYDDYSKDELKLMVRNISRMLVLVWNALSERRGVDPLDAWNSYCMTAARNQNADPSVG